MWEKFENEGQISILEALECYKTLYTEVLIKFSETGKRREV